MYGLVSIDPSRCNKQNVKSQWLNKTVPYFGSRKVLYGARQVSREGQKESKGKRMLKDPPSGN